MGLFVKTHGVVCKKNMGFFVKSHGVNSLRRNIKQHGVFMLNPMVSMFNPEPR